MPLILSTEDEAVTSLNRFLADAKRYYITEHLQVNAILDQATTASDMKLLAVLDMQPGTGGRTHEEW